MLDLSAGFFMYASFLYLLHAAYDQKVESTKDSALDPYNHYILLIFLGYIWKWMSFYFFRCFT